MESIEESFNYRGPKPRNEIENMQSYQAPLEGRRGFLRLDFNENTIGPSPFVIKAIKEICSEEISIYPEYEGLREAYIKNLQEINPLIKITSNQIGIFNGVDAAIHSIFHSHGDYNDSFLTTNPTFGYYAPCALMQGMKIIKIPYEGKEFDFPLNKIHEELICQSPKIMLICNPNNPTGTRLSPDKIIELAKLAPKTLIVIDELYEAFTGDSILPRVNFTITPNLLILRSLSKTAGLAGLRIGFAIGNEYTISRISRVNGPYDINSFAVKGAFAALEDQEYTNSYINKVLVAKEWIKGKLESKNIRSHFGGGNYFLIWPENANKVEAFLKSSNILVRNMKGKDLINGSLRVSIGTQEQMETFWKELDKIV